MLYSVAVLFFRIILYPVLFPKFYGRENAVDMKNTIIMCSHRHWYDPALVAFVATQPLHFMAKLELFKNKLLGIILPHCNAFPVERGAADVKAIKTAIKVLKDGNALLIFPEGTRVQSASDEMTEFHNGVSFLAYKSGADVLPVYIDSQRHGIRTVTAFGEKIHTTGMEGDRKQQMETLNAALMESMKQLRLQTKAKNKANK